MCGIIGYLGFRPAAKVLLDGLKRLEYRGYDSAGIAVLDGGEIDIRRATGKLAALIDQIGSNPPAGHLGIGHTRWATHGRPSDTNAHPHQAGDITLIHNGIIENYSELKAELSAKGRGFASETDTEVIAHLIDQVWGETGDFEAAVAEALARIKGAYALLIINQKVPQTIIAARKESPLIVGLGEDETFFASDAPAFLSHTNRVIFLDDYDHKLDGSGLDLPRNDYDTDPPLQDRTAAAIFSLVQDPLPITVAGTVFEDVNADNSQGPGEPGLENVELKLYVLEGGQYVATAHTTRTDANGDYLFEDVLPGVYRIVETQPDGYMSVGASAGTVGGQPRGEVAGDDPDAIFNLQLLGGDESVDNDFAETQPAKLSGNVYHDVDNDGVFDDGETGIGGVLIVVQYIEPSVNPLQLNPVTPVISPQAETTTNPDGSWSVGNLMPGNYQITEIHPNGYLDGLDAAGTAGGTAHNPGDLIDDVWLPSGRWGQEYNFGELLPARISGHVIDDYNANGLYDPGETPIAGVTVHLLDAAGDRIRSMQTDPNGEYSFTGLEPGVYGVEEIQPAGYFDGADLVGSEDGMPLPPDSIIGVTLVSGTEAVDYDFLEILPASISGRVVVDVNENCTFDQGDVALGGVTVYLLDAIGNRIDSTTTDANGEYAFTNLTPGVYGVEEIQPEGYFDSGECVGSEGGRLQPPDFIVDVELFSGTDAVGYNFRHVLDVSENQAFAIAGRRYLIEFQLTPVSGQVILVRFRVNVI